MEYTVISLTNLTDFIKAISEYLRAGWKLEGNLCTHCYSGHTIENVYSQALTKR